MPSIDSVKRITVEDFRDEDKEVAERIGVTYNYFAEQVTNVLNGGIDFENMNRSTISVQLAVDSTGNPSQVSKFTAAVGVQGINIIRAENLTSRTNYVVSAPFMSYTSSGDGVYTIDNIKGLVTNDNYRLLVELIF